MLKMSNQEKIKLLVAIYEQHWLHARHVENERLWFTNIYAIILAGTLSLLSIPTYSGFYVAVLIFLLSLTMIGILFSLKVKLTFRWYTAKAMQIMKDYKLDNYRIDITKPQTVIEKISVSSLFPMFYGFCFSMLSSLLTYTLTEHIFFSLTTFGVLVCSLTFSIHYLSKFRL